MCEVGRYNIDYAGVIGLRDEAVADMRAVGLYPPLDMISRWDFGVDMPDWGQCSRLLDGKFAIRIQRAFLVDGHPKAIRNTIAHELIHAIYPGTGHGAHFKMAAYRMNSQYPWKYSISRCAEAASQMSIEAAAVNYRYVIKCENCGAFWLARRKTRFVREPERYRCTQCNNALVRYK